MPGGFHGGIHPPGNKDLTSARPVERMPLPDVLVVPMSQHLGAPCTPTVQVGDRVARGQLIGEVEAVVSALVHAPAAGEVVAVGPALTPAGVRTMCVTIAVDREADQNEYLPFSGPLTCGGDMARAAGLVGMGGAAFPSAVKLQPPRHLAVDTVIINGCECEPFLTCDHRVMVEMPEQVVAGARHVRDCVAAKRVVIAVEDNKPDAIEALKAAAGDDVEVVAVPARYPQGAEKQLIKTITGRSVAPGKLPVTVGCLVHNVQTAVALRDAMDDLKPLMERVVTVSGAVGRPGNYRVALGTKVSDLLEFAGGLTDDAVRVIAGGPMTAQPLADLDVPIVKGTSGIVALTAEQAAPIVETDQPCIRCGRCVEACPALLHPYAIANYADRRLWDGCERFFALDCIECGCCSYVCPTRRPLLQLIRKGKSALAAKGAR